MKRIPGRGDRRRLVLAGAAGLAVLLLLLAFGYRLSFRDRVYPGVHIGDIDVGALSAQEVVARLGAAGVLAADTPVTLRDPDDGRTWQRPAADLGLDLDPAALAEAALAVGREGANPLAQLFQPLLFPFTHPGIPLAAAFDAGRAQAALTAFAPEVDVAPVDAGLSPEGGGVVAQPSTIGHQLDISGTLRALAALAERPVTDTLDIVVQRTGARVGDLGNVAAAYNTVVSGPLDVGYQNVARFTVPVATLREWVAVADLPGPSGDPVPTITFDRAAMAAWLEAQRAAIDQPAESARFGFDSQGLLAVTRQGRQGLALDVPRSVDALIEAAYRLERVGELVVEATPPLVPPSILGRLAGHRELARASTAIAGLPPHWRAQLKAAVAQVDGVVIPPSGPFSLAEALGPLTPERGFDPAYTALGTADGAIGQLCTTLLRAAWWGGVPVTARQAPPVRPGYIEPPIGLDCAIGPAADLQLFHDGTGYLRFGVVLDEARGVLTVLLFGPERERVVTTLGPTVSELAAAGGRRREETAAWPAGTSEVVQPAREGATVRIERTVQEGDTPVTRDSWTSRYAPAAELTLVGTGP